MIKLLDKTTIDKIAAGEVIERPSSVVKELVENSIDAGATSVTVEIKEGGISFIRVTDNGYGISKDEIRTAYLRHATSKIENAGDLDSIETLGFRGEALATIAAVSQTEMVTKTVESLTGVKYVIHGGEEVEFKEVGVPDGTTIVVRNLFYNTPARKKFLKTPMTEGSYITDLVTKIALSHPDISIKLIINGQSKISTTGNGNVRDVIYQLYGKDITSALLEVSYSSGDISITGYVAKPYICRGNRGLENYFINNRYIKNVIINRAIEEGYKTYVMQHKFPFAVLFYELPYENCDVNVHPTKMEFKYENEKELFEATLTAVKDALAQKELIPPAKDSGRADWGTVKPEKTTERGAEPFEVNRGIPKPSYNAGKYSQSYNALQTLKKQEQQETNESNTEAVIPTEIKRESVMEREKTEVLEASPQKHIYNTNGVYTTSKPLAEDELPEHLQSAVSKVNGRQMSIFNDEILPEKEKIRYRLIGQLFDTYWLIEYDRNLYIMDQHAAHEKIKYEQLMRDFKSKEILSQQLMPPLVITVTYQEREAVLEYYDLFMQIGYDIEEFGGNEFKINAVPSNLYGISERALFMEFVSSLIENNGYVSNDIFIRKLSTMACKSAIKGNTHITYQEADNLVKQLLELENPYTCPHGRPTIISMSEAEIEKKFRRIV
jgi:DNA mismatch repair protein MutL